MRQLREFAQQHEEFAKANVSLVAISSDDAEQARHVWERAALKRFPVLTDPGAKVIREYGVVQVYGGRRPDGAIRTTLLLDEQGIVRWSEIAGTANQTPKPETLLEELGKLN
jgi:peroxiredoxin